MFKDYSHTCFNHHHTEFVAPEINPERYNDLLDYVYWTRLSLQQLAQYLSGQDDEEVILAECAYYDAKLATWLTDSCYQNQAYRGKLIKTTF